MKKLLQQLFANYPAYEDLLSFLKNSENNIINVDNIFSSFKSLLIADILSKSNSNHCIILDDKESAAYFYDDLTNILGSDKNVSLLPSVFKHGYDFSSSDSTNLVLKTEAVSKILKSKQHFILVTYPDAIIEKIVDAKEFESNSLEIATGDTLTMDSLIETLNNFGFSGEHFVTEPGNFAVRGSLVDVFSFNSELPYRIDFFGDTIDSIRTFDIETQLSISKLNKITLIPDINNINAKAEKTPIFEILNIKKWVFWLSNYHDIINRIDKVYEYNQKIIEEQNEFSAVQAKEAFVIDSNLFVDNIKKYKNINFCQKNNSDTKFISFNLSPQPVFRKKFDLFLSDIKEKTESNYSIFILSNNPKQIQRIKDIFEEKDCSLDFTPVYEIINKGFVCHDKKICVYTDHEIFDRFHRYKVKSFSKKESMSLNELSGLEQGDYVVHIDNGIGKFGGLQKININGKIQEVISIIYGNNDILYVNIHSLHKISKYRSKEGEAPKIHPLGSGMWKRLKERTKKNIKDIAKELIMLYAARKNSTGFSFSPDSSMQYELEASFMYEDTPDQVKCNDDIRNDMESEVPMDRLICGDVGFGKTELAVRAAFKAACDNKQVAILVPTTILALQHYQTFSERLKDFPVSIALICRLRTNTEIKKTLENVKNGKVDIIIGTHRIVNKDVVFKDLGLLVVDEEQKFGVGLKEKIRQMKVSIDTLTLSATPIPRTLQFSLMGARDMSILTMPPPNRQPVNTEVHVFNPEIIKEAINYEINRNGQVFFIHNRVQNIQEIEDLIKKLCPNVKTIVAHGQMEASKLEKIILNFIRGDYDILISTTIIENGVDIPNVNTIIINEANRFGLSDLHQLRGRVGRSNKKSFCYLFSPPMEDITPEARRRLKAIEEFSELGSGLNIALQDLDIRGAGNVLGSEQSGFIADIGYETYMKILNEALEEMRYSDTENLFPTQNNISKISSSNDCNVETDFSIFIPDYFISNTTERIKIYKELDNVKSENDLNTFRNNLVDRFGKIPEETNNLFKIVELRLITARFFFTKITIKNSLFVANFPAEEKHPFYNSDDFTLIINYVQQNQRDSSITTHNNSFILKIKNIDSIDKILNIFLAINKSEKI